jgi:hypothetical protein
MADYLSGVNTILHEDSIPEALAQEKHLDEYVPACRGLDIRVCVIDGMTSWYSSYVSLKQCDHTLPTDQRDEFLRLVV